MFLKANHRTYLFLILLLFVSGYVLAQKRKDEPTSYKDDLTFKWKKSFDTLQLLATSKSLASIQVLVFDRKTDNELKSYFLASKDSIVLFLFRNIAYDSVLKNKLNDSLRISYFLGHPDVIKPDLNYAYQFPFKKGKKYEVSQSFNGKASHFGEKSKYALDFQLNIGEPIYAARGGLVVKSIDWFTKQGGVELRNAANRIVVLHADGTLATYAHLQYKGCLVREGQEVKEGQKIGVSGLTGHTRGPHLHFVVRKERDIAIPIYFKGYPGIVLQQGKRYKIK